ncbi:methyltransferase domain-containing protein [Bradyrhizobium symbiodeficiens]|uniref:class I SAM-dependent methyltransferase n=1 Tax=Bradyrhizobium symbiodeficiens TaxID=1404367 RepID=UPI0030D1D84E
MTKNNDEPSTWDREYQLLRSIPSSGRKAPSKALRILAPLADLPKTELALDAGCGNGRNAVFLAKQGCRVIAADFSDAALDLTRSLSAEYKVHSLVEPAKLNLHGVFPYRDRTFNLCLDSYVSCHFGDEDDFAQYWSELTRVTKDGGLIFTSMFCEDDQLYAKYKHSTPNHQEATDPANGITKILYTEQQFKSLFKPPLRIEYFVKFQFADVVSGIEYIRSLLVALLVKAA